ncbi:hypothetical protein LOZ57_005480 [Ophidiomyces ophidiicola]|uniref:uncharacterized protein n=1 Tax=Ophidiomyces ophidiicola TaxID=1387563 RepID=UPI0020C21F79|nr:uncharacterized protein LOZ57_005480 [Ophidiomyces ophidiicola]KAI1941691.1 hypothetical protein LOZ57_005480 [Ophidiomyces ophidiicola]KAI2046365.1 hypothetical protein LOZ43_005894 [Ophidiomyces ophidiicola]
MDGTIILTGASGALGQELAKQLLLRPQSYTFLFPVRSRQNAHAQKLQQLLDTHGTGVHTTSMPEVDLASFASIRAFVSDVNSKVSTGEIPPIRALILNAAFFFQRSGLQFTEQQTKNQPPFEMHFAVNHLANVLLTLLLLESMDPQHGRIVYTSSWAHDPNRPENQRSAPEKLPWDVGELAHPDMRKFESDPTRNRDPEAEGMRRYGASKMALITFMHALRKRLDKVPRLENISIVGVDPGGMLHEHVVERASWANRISTVPLIRLYVLLVAQYWWPNGMFRTVKKSAQDLLHATLESNASWVQPKDAYFNGNEPAESAAASKDPERQKELWQMSLGYVELEESHTALDASFKRPPDKPRV